jgi:uncharacterized membrane protein YccC
MDAGRFAQTRNEELLLALSRLIEIALGCVVAIILAWIYTKLIEKVRAHRQPSRPQAEGE